MGKEENKDIKISDLRFRLRDSQSARIEEMEELVNEITDLKHDANQLLPELCSAVEATYFPPSMMCELLLAVKSTDLLEAIFRSYEPNYFSPWEKCELLSAGFSDFEQELLDELLSKHAAMECPWIVDLCTALGDSGTENSLETLRVTEYRVRKLVEEFEERLSKEDDPTQELDFLVLITKRGLLKALRKNIERVESRRFR